ncbi:hypothetical protein BV902_17635 [Sphingobacterium sp. B29]|uniref:LicD family protein n=1 Tax=Sphingobacterium sp. B29 TaxID=1933220 RepID=UPI000958AD7F|nr:LicD family protein [Sphingobacterium sp. B29]APU97932.1 hypothetical protein BV902_17635 [Sphingobacterium sp. B29]
MEKYTVTPTLKYYKNDYKKSAKEGSDQLALGEDYQSRYGAKIPDYEVNLFQVHHAIWKDFLENSTKDYCLIQEHGTAILKDLTEIKSVLLEQDLNFHVLFPFDLINSDTRLKMPIAFSRFGFYWGTSSYIISRKSIKELIEKCSEIRWPLAEQFLELGIDRKIKMIAVDTDWTMFSDRKAPSYLARKNSMIEYIRSYSAWEKDEISQVRGILTYLSETAASLDVKIFLHAGTLLGSIRHSGKIMPWDDDIDLMVKKEDLIKLIPAIRQDGIYNVTEWTWSKTGKTYYKIWKEGGYKTEGYEYTFPFVDIWWTEEIGNKVHTNDGYVFEKQSYFPLQPIEFENAKFYHPAVATDILDTMYKGWRNEIKIFSWSHKFKKHSVKQISVPITTDKKGRFTNYK